MLIFRLRSRFVLGYEWKRFTRVNAPKTHRIPRTVRSSVLAPVSLSLPPHQSCRYVTWWGTVMSQSPTITDEAFPDQRFLREKMSVCPWRLRPFWLSGSLTCKESTNRWKKEKNRKRRGTCPLNKTVWMAMSSHVQYAILHGPTISLHTDVDEGCQSSRSR